MEKTFWLRKISKKSHFSYEYMNDYSRFSISNIFSEFKSHLNAKENQKMFKEMGVKTFILVNT